VTGVINFGKITDGTSNTMMYSEKFVRVDAYQGGAGADDRGWSDGWDPDTIRMTCLPPRSDSDGYTFAPTVAGDSVENYNGNPQLGNSGTILNFGSAHPAGINAVYADASVHSISFDVDEILFNLLGDRRDGHTFDQSDL
jgi:hypothetical protein